MLEKTKVVSEEKTSTNEGEKKKTMRTAFIRVSLLNHISQDNEELGVKKGDTVSYTVEEIKETLDDWNLTKKFDYYMILHDEGNPHVHIVIEFSKRSLCAFGTLKKKFPWGQINSCKNVRACVRYLPHIDYPEKQQYDWSDVITNNPDRLEKRYIPDEDIFDIDVIVDKIFKGEIKPFEIYKIPPEVYLNEYTTIKRAFEYREERLLTNPNRKIEVYVLQGSPRVGKTTFCKALAEKEGKSICFSSSSRDPWQDYKGQDIFAYDDFDYSKIDIEDFKKALDPYTSTTMSRRYRNILFTGDTILICTNTPIGDWFQYSDDKSREAVFKRIKKVYDFKNFDELPFNSDISVFDVTNNLQKSEGTSYYTINKLVPTNDFKDIHDKKTGFIVDNYRVWNLEPIDEKIHEFDLKKYIDTDNGENKKADCIKNFEDI